MNQELMIKFQMFEQQIQQIQQQLEAVEKGTVELSSLNLGLDELKGAKGKEIMAPIGRGIFAKAKLISEDLFKNNSGDWEKRELNWITRWKILIKN